MSRIRFFILIIVLVFLFGVVRGQQDTMVLDVYTVSASRVPSGFETVFFTARSISAEEITALNPADLHSLIDMLSSVDVRQRGPNGVQADISISGGSFEQTLILVNGVPFNDPQTGHHNLNLPFQVSDIERVEILTGPGSRFFGEGAMTGAVNIITRKNDKPGNSIAAKFTGGEYRYHSAEAALKFKIGKWGQYISVSDGASAGYVRNTDFTSKHLWGSGYRDFNGVKLLINGGWNNRFFGANSFYSPLYPDQAEEVSVLTGHIGLTGGSKIMWSADVHFRRHDDRFELFRYEYPEWYKGHNYHRSLTRGVAMRAQTGSVVGLSRIGFAYRNEAVISNLLGYDRDTIFNKNRNAYYNKEADRNLADIYADHSFKFKSVSLSIGSLLFVFPDKKAGLYPGIDVNYKTGEKVSFHAGLNKSFRLPGFTDLFYSSPTNIGNPDLKHEEAVSLFLGGKYQAGGFSAGSILFLRDNRNMIDWVKKEGDQQWQAINLTRIHTFGSELSLNLKPVITTPWFNSIRVEWCFTEQIKKMPDSIISYYILDHLKNKFTLSASHSQGSRLSVHWDAVYQQRSGSFTDIQGNEQLYPDAFILNAGVGFVVAESIKLNIRISNILSSRHIDFGGVALPGRWIMVSVLFCSAL